MKGRYEKSENCGYTLWRDKRCRKLANTYRCPNCGFEGP
ncbi:MAG: zinc finger domain-containing protein [Candidatus Methanomethylicia archaeon]